MLNNGIIYFLSFVGIWLGSGLAVRSTEKLAKILRISSFLVSFLILGILTSVSEFSVGINSLIENNPEIYVGNLVGASIVLFLLIIPLLTLSGNKIRINPEFQGFNLPASLIIVALPTFLVLDGLVDRTDGFIAVFLFAIFIISLHLRKDFFKINKKLRITSRKGANKELIKIIFGIVIIFIASKFIINQTEYFSQRLNFPAFFISLFLISIGTNIPELSFVIRALFSRNNEIAFGCYLGSAIINTFIFGLLTIFNGKSISLSNSYLTSLFFVIIGLVMFYRFSKTRNSISRKEGAILLSVYVLFFLIELIGQKFLF